MIVQFGLRDGSSNDYFILQEAFDRLAIASVVREIQEDDLLFDWVNKNTNIEWMQTWSVMTEFLSSMTIQLVLQVIAFKF